MGEKETATAEALQSTERQTQQSSFGDRAQHPRETGSGMATGRTAGGVTHEDDWDKQGLVTGGGDGGPEPAEGAIIKSKSNITNNREASGGDEGGPEPAAETIIKSKSNITNNREGQPDDEGLPDPAAINLNTSRSGIYRTAVPGAGGGEPGLAIGDQGAVEDKNGPPRPKK